MQDHAEPTRPPGPVERVLTLLGEVRPGESGRLGLLCLNLFLVLVGYYVIKTVREPLILASGGAEMKSYASAVMAALLVVFVPAYSWLASKVARLRLIIAVTLFFVGCIELFYIGAQLGVPQLGFVFYVWVGIFNVAIIAQFWSYANDLYVEADGKRLFPIIAIGATVGSPLGSMLAKVLFDAGVDAYSMLHVTAVILVIHLVIYGWIERTPGSPGAAAASSAPALRPGDGFALVLRSPMIRLIALLLIMLNLVNTTGEYILGKMVLEAAREAAANDGTDIKAFIGSFYGSFFSIVNVATIVIQALIVSRLVRYLGIAGVVLALPVVAFGAYGLIGAGVGLAVVRWAKTAENSTDYSVMNTAKAMLWLPTTREEKYKAKQAVDTFFVRVGDVLSALLVFVGSTWLGLEVQSFAVANVVLIVVWFAVGVLVVREYHRLSAQRAAEHG